MNYKKLRVLDGNGIWTKVTRLEKVPIKDPVHIFLNNGLSLITEKGFKLATRTGYRRAQRLNIPACDHNYPEDIMRERKHFLSCEIPQFSINAEYAFQLDPYELGVYIATGEGKKLYNIEIEPSKIALEYLEDSEVFRQVDGKFIHCDQNSVDYIIRTCGSGINKRLPRVATTFGRENFMRMIGGILDSIGVIEGKMYMNILIKTKSHTLVNSLLLTLWSNNFNVYGYEEDGIYIIKFLEPEERMKEFINHSNLYVKFQEYRDWRKHYTKLDTGLSRKTQYFIDKILTPDMGGLDYMYSIETQEGHLCANGILVDTLPGFEYIKEKRSWLLDDTSLYTDLSQI